MLIKAKAASASGRLWVRVGHSRAVQRGVASLLNLEQTSNGFPPLLARRCVGRLLIKRSTHRGVNKWVFWHPLSHCIIRYVAS